MAIYHASTKPIARSAGRSAVAAAAYRAGVELVDARTGLVHDYARKGGVLHTEILTPDGDGAERNALWDAAESAEKRKDARTAREWIVALPEELDVHQQRALVREFSQVLVDRYGVAVDLVIHAPDREGDNRNFHAHILTTTRQVSRGLDGGLVFGAKSQIELGDKDRKKMGLTGKGADEVKAIRELWERTANGALERAGVDARIDARSFKDRGVDREPTKHLGPVATDMERQGKESDRGDINQEIMISNIQRARLSAEIVGLQAERERRIRREQARQAFAVSHREIRPDVGLTAPVLAVAVEAWARQDRVDIQVRWNERLAKHDEKKEAARLAGIEARRQKLLGLAESLRNDADAKMNLREAYLSAGYARERREGKVFFVYPSGGFSEERKGVSQARTVWNERAAQIRVEREQEEMRLKREAILERAQLRHGYRTDAWEIQSRWSWRQQRREAERLLEEHERLEQKNHVLDDLVAEETAPGVRHPQRSTWREWREQTLSRKYDPAYSAKMAERDIYCRWMPEHGGLYLRLGKAEVIDQGPLLLAQNGTGDIPLMIETAQAKGWETLEFTGDAKFQEQAAMAALRAGLKVVDADLARRAEEAVEVQDRQGKLRVLAETLRADVDTKMDLRKAYLAAGYAIEQREGKAVFAYPPGDLAEERKDVTQARKDWNERAAQIKALREPKSQITAYGAEYARRDDWKGVFTGAVIAVDEGHVYVGAKGGGGAPHFVAIPKERFKTLPSKGLYATFTPGDAQRPAGWNKVLGRMNGQGRLVRTPDKGKGIGD